MTTHVSNWQVIKEALLGLLAGIGDLIQWPSSIKIVDEHDAGLILSARFRRIDVDRACACIKRNGRTVCRFVDIDAIHIAHRRGGKGRQWWLVSLHRRGAGSLRIGRSSDQLEASSVAARLATLTGKPVLAVR